MAAIDKLYASHDEHRELVDWLTENAPAMLRSVRPIEPQVHVKVTHAAAQFTQEQDMYLLVHCPLKWATDQIREQYDWGWAQRRDASWFRCPYCGGIGSSDLDLDCDCIHDY